MTLNTQQLVADLTALNIRVQRITDRRDHLEIYLYLNGSVEQFLFKVGDSNEDYADFLIALAKKTK